MDFSHHDHKRRDLYKTASYNPNGADIQWNTWNNIQWYYDEDTKTLTIGGEGAVPQSTESDPYPWDEYKDELEHVVIEEGITEIWSSTIYKYRKMVTFTMPSTVSKIMFDELGFGTCDLQSIIVNANNPDFVSVDGVLYSKDMTVLYVYPSASSMTTFTVPDTVEEMTYSMFTSALHLKTLYIPASVKTIWDVHSMSNMCAIEEIHVASDNPNYCSVDGILYSKDMTTLYQYPNRKADTVYTIPDTVTTISWYSFYHSQYLETLYMGENVENVNGNLFFYDSEWSNNIDITSVYFPGDFPTYFEEAFSNIADKITFYYPVGASGWTSPTMTINGVTYKTASYTKYTAGDLTGDGDIDADDLSLLQDYFSGNTSATFDTTKADFNGDGKFTRADVMYLARALANWEGYKIG